MEYLFNGIVLSGAFALLCVLGLPLAFRMDPRNGWILSPIIGLSLLTVVSTLLYRLGLSLSTIGAGILLAAPVVIVLDRGTCSKAVRSFSPARAAFLSFLACVVAMLAPMWAGGAQFSVFQGNQWDHFNYIACAAAYGRNAYSAAVSAGTPEFLDNPLMIWGNDLIVARPSVTFLFALFLKMTGARMYVATYSFRVLLLALSVFPIHMIIDRFRTASGKPGDWTVGAASVCFPLGFWGQYVFDINAWSQISSIAPLVAVVALNAGWIRKRVDGERPPAFLFAGLAVCWAGSAFLYPENTLYHLAAVSGAIAAAAWLGGMARGDAARLMGANLAGVSLCLLHFDATFAFILRQFRFGVSSGTDYWIYFQNFLFGHDNVLDHVIDAVNRAHPAATFPAKRDLAVGYLKGRALSPEILPRLLSLPATVVVGLSGFYFGMPSGPMAPVTRLATNYLLLAVVLLVWRRVWTTVRESLGTVPGPVFHFHAGFVAAFLAGLLLLVARSQFWAAGKGFSFFSPYLVLVTLIPFLVLWARRDGTGRPLYSRISKPVLAIALLPVILHLSSGMLRTVKAADPAGIHYPAPYPSIQDPALKRNLRWELDESELSGCRVVRLDVSNPFAQVYWMSVVYSRGIDFHIPGVVNTGYGRGTDLGPMRNPGVADCRIVDVRSADNVTRMTVLRNP